MQARPFTSLSSTSAQRPCPLPRDPRRWIMALSFLVPVSGLLLVYGLRDPAYKRVTDERVARREALINRCWNHEPGACETARKILSEEIRAGDADANFHLASISEDKQQALRYMGDACHQGTYLAGEACFRAGRGVAALEPDPGLRDSQAARFYKRGCEEFANPRSCYEWYLALELGQGVQKDEAAAAAGQERTCKNGKSLWSCTRWARLLASGIGVAPNVKQALELNRDACAQKDGLACLQAAHLYANHAEVLRDIPMAVYYAEKACGFEDPDGCYLAGYLEKKRGRVEQAKRNFKTGCDLGDLLSCNQLGAELLDTDYRSACDLFLKACRSGLDVACRNEKSNSCSLPRTL